MTQGYRANFICVDEIPKKPRCINEPKVISPLEVCFDYVAARENTRRAWDEAVARWGWD